MARTDRRIRNTTTKSNTDENTMDITQTRPRPNSRHSHHHGTTRAIDPRPMRLLQRHVVETSGCEPRGSATTPTHPVGNGPADTPRICELNTSTQSSIKYSQPHTPGGMRVLQFHAIGSQHGIGYLPNPDGLVVSHCGSIEGRRMSSARVYHQPTPHPQETRQ